VIGLLAARNRFPHAAQLGLQVFGKSVSLGGWLGSGSRVLSSAADSSSSAESAAGMNVPVKFEGTGLLPAVEEWSAGGDSQLKSQSGQSSMRS
jgi:hypothetical protein